MVFDCEKKAPKRVSANNIKKSMSLETFNAVLDNKPEDKLGQTDKPHSCMCSTLVLLLA